MRRPDERMLTFFSYICTGWTGHDKKAQTYISISCHSERFHFWRACKYL